MAAITRLRLPILRDQQLLVWPAHGKCPDIIFERARLFFCHRCRRPDTRFFVLDREVHIVARDGDGHAVEIAFVDVLADLVRAHHDGQRCRHAQEALGPSEQPRHDHDEPQRTSATKASRMIGRRVAELLEFVIFPIAGSFAQTCPPISTMA